jgi:hypothetical protein
MKHDKRPFSRDEIRDWIDRLATQLEEWQAIIGEPTEGSELDEFKKVLEDTTRCLSRFSYSLFTHGMQAADSGR